MIGKTMEALDNPSYFSLPGGSTKLPPRRVFGPLSLLKHRGSREMGSKASCSAPATPTFAEGSSLPLVGTGHSHRRSFRSLLRSVSASAGFHLQHQHIVLGGPRPSDVAPESPRYSSSPSSSEHHFQLHFPNPREQSKQKHMKLLRSSTELLNNDMVYFPVPDSSNFSTPPVPTATTSASEDLGGGRSPEEVSLGEEDARYYNLAATMTIPLNGGNTTSDASTRRRHSVGTFLSNKERSTSLSKIPTSGQSSSVSSVAAAGSCEERKLQQLDTPTDSEGHSPARITRTAHARRRCNRCCNVKGNRGADMEDILIVSSHLSQASSLWVNYLTVCFQQISKSRKKPPFRILHVGIEDVTDSQGIPAAMQERMIQVKLQIVILCPQFLQHVYHNPGPSTALGALLRPDRVLAMLLGVEESAVTEQHRAALISYQDWCHFIVKDQDESFVSKFLQEALDVMARVWQQQKRADKAHFSLVPKKVKEGHNKLIVLLSEPIEKEDKVRITVDKNGEMLDITTMKRRNPYTLQFQMPESCLEVSMLVNVLVQKNGQALGSRQVKCESRMRELDQILRAVDNPLGFMCQTLGYSIGDREHLDSFLLAVFQRNIPPHLNILNTAGQPGNRRNHGSSEEYPTLLHFAAKFGLEKLTWQLLECPGGDYACEVRNACELTPAEMAEAAGHTKLANALRGYMQMTEFTSMYSYMKIMSEGKAAPAYLDGAEYHHPRPLSETYQVPPGAYRLIENYQIPPTARPYAPYVNETAGYMDMHHAGNKKCDSKQTTDLGKEEVTHASRSLASTEKDSSSKTSSPDKLYIGAVSTKKSQEQIQQPFGIQDELVEIINDFKNNVFTITEVEKLVESWQNRNDVKQSFREKQEQLNKMRDEYERLQQQMKENMQRPTPFDRIRNFFRGKPKDKEKTSPCCSAANTPSSAAETGDLHSSSRLSLHSSSSSSSSGRLSNASGCSVMSLGDSGTQSDAEEKKMFPFHKLSPRMKLGIHSYEIPPTPRPLAYPTVVSVTIEHRPSVPSSQVVVHQQKTAPAGTELPVSQQSQGRTSVLKEVVAEIPEASQSEDCQYLILENNNDDLSPNHNSKTAERKSNVERNTQKEHISPTNMGGNSGTEDMPDYINVTASAAEYKKTASKNIKK